MKNDLKYFRPHVEVNQFQNRPAPLPGIAAETAPSATPEAVAIITSFAKSHPDLSLVNNSVPAFNTPPIAAPIAI